MKSFIRTAVLFITLPLVLTFGDLSTVNASNKGTFMSACKCVDENNLACFGTYRWDVKIDKAMAPENVTDITPSKMGAWAGPGGKFGYNTKRIPEEEKWYRATGKVTLVRAEPDGDLHIQMVDKDAKGDAVNIVVEVPNGTKWCSIRKTIFGWTSAKFPRGNGALTLEKEPVIVVTGKAFYDGQHGDKKKTSNRRKGSAGGKPTTVWEIHPVMKMEVISE